MATTLSDLLDRNVAWVRNKTFNDPDFFRRMSEDQHPQYLWVGCSDSRVTANDVLGLDPGEVFVHRNIANIVHTSDLNILSVLEFAVDYLQIPHIIVCGHYGCGGVKRSIADERGALIDNWLQPLSMLYRRYKDLFNRVGDVGDRLDYLCEVNVGLQVRRLAATPIVENAWARGQELHLHGWIYAVSDGLLRDLGPHLSSIGDREKLPAIDEELRRRRSKPLSSAMDQAVDAFGK